MGRTRPPGPIAYGPRTGQTGIGAPRGSGARQYNPFQWSGVKLAQRSDQLDNTLGAGVTEEQLIVQATPSSAAPEICEVCRYWTVQGVSHSLTGDAGQPTPSREALVQTGNRLSDLQALVEFSDGSGQRQKVPVDMGPGWGIRFWGNAPKVYLLLDAGTFIYTQGGQPSPVPAGTLTSHVVEATLQCSDTWTGRSLWQSTVTRQVPANTLVAYPVQPRAQFVEVRQSFDGPAATSLEIRSIDGQNLGLYPLDAATRGGPRIRLPGGAATLNTPASVGVLRVFSVVYEVEL